MGSRLIAKIKAEGGLFAMAKKKKPGKKLRKFVKKTGKRIAKKAKAGEYHPTEIYNTEL